MSLKHLGMIELPANTQAGGLDHAAVHRASSRLYVAHTANDALDVIDCATDTFLHSIPGLAGVAGALVSDETAQVFTSNRGENTVGMFAPDDEATLVRVEVGLKPNGLAFDAKRGLLLAANVGDPAQPQTHTLNVPMLNNDDPVPPFSPNDVLCPVITYVCLGVYNGLRRASDGAWWRRMCSVLVIVALAR